MASSWLVLKQLNGCPTGISSTLANKWVVVPRVLNDVLRLVISSSRQTPSLCLLHTVFIRIVAAATINFSLAGVRLLIEGSSFSRAAFIYLDSGYLCADPVVSWCDRLVFQD